ncbi:dihydrofolate reductase [Gigaspora margarita]|uniref:Dihydrofolate reductase n=1 Tax=Gigaspora margarita TaxID=4874 RepID=A0A8H4A4L3_GIGMA|nr:dihydrofolate reductase [Gigaspora margarita]
MFLFKPPKFALIAAAEENWGIGINNALPWKIKEDMAYFERVTKKVLVSDETTDTSLATSGKSVQNAVIMGRKTWESIPPKFRPLKDRLNVVLSKSLKPESDMYVIHSSLDEAVANLVGKPTIARIFIIGGGYVYKEAIESPLCEYILITKVYKNFNCDTFFPKIDENMYELASHDELVNFVGNDVPKGRQVEGEIEYEFLMYKRNKDEGDDGSKPNERSRLIPGDGNSYVEQRMTYPRYDAAADRDRERESLQKIVQRTAENLIDISNAHVTERLQQQDVIDRANEYKDFISTIKLDSKTLQKIQEKSTLPKLQNRKSLSLSQISDVQNATLIPPHVVLSDGGLTKEDQVWLHKAMDEIHDAIDHIEVEYVGDLVVSLT